eukprot:TRINITY_DN23283_c0_g1_i4.p1 TRINITY_DN23283_c0_g1~~TRINITY_DN23283_c0_g1_i4.p1  ORF type:complete len:493 (+),score=126.19 TRINITY_DN23283_c0_g1_i4:254-1732(+)
MEPMLTDPGADQHTLLDPEAKSQDPEDARPRRQVRSYSQDVMAGKSDDHPGEPEEPKSSIFASVINLSNTILGAGLLAMPYACKQCGIIIFGILLVLVALASHFGIRLLSVAVLKRDMVGAKYPSLGYEAFGRAGEVSAGMAVILQQLGPCIMYIQVSSDVLKPIACKLAGDSSVVCSRVFWQLLAVGAVALPTSLIRRMDALKYISAAAMFFILSFSLMVVARGIWVLADTDLRWENYKWTEDHWSTSLEPGCEDYHSGCYEIIPPGDTVRLAEFSSNILKALPILCFAFLCHQNMFPVLDELEETSIKRMSRVSVYTMSSCVLMYFVVGVFGYLTFLDSVDPNRHTKVSGDVMILYKDGSSGKDFALWMDVLRVGYGISLIFSYPIMLFELRHSIEKLAFGDEPYSFKRHLLINLAIIVPCTIVAIFVESVGTVFGLVGSTTSPTIVFILPSLFYLKLREDGKMRSVAKVLLVLGVLMIPICVVMWGINL